MATTAKFKVPKTLAACADLYYVTRERRLALQKEVDKLEVEEKALKTYLIDNLPKSEASGVAGQVARVTAVTKTTVSVTDWAKVWAYVRKTGEDDLIQHRVNETAVKARWDAKKKVPGTEPFNYVTLSVNKV